MKANPYMPEGNFRAHVAQRHLLLFPLTQSGLFGFLDRSQFPHFHCREKPFHARENSRVHSDVRERADTKNSVSPTFDGIRQCWITRAYRASCIDEAQRAMRDRDTGTRRVHVGM